MKKLSFSLVALLAIVFAIASAFTSVSKSQTSLTHTYKVFDGQQEPAGLGNFSQSIGTYSNKLDEQVQNVPIDLDPYGCDGAQTYLCVIEFTDDSFAGDYREGVRP